MLVRRQQPGEVPGGRRVAVRADRGRGGRAGGRAGPVRARRRRIRAIRLQERAKFRTRVPFYDYTFSAPKSVSVLWASLLAAAAEAEAAGRRSGGRAARGAGRAGARSGEAGQRPDDGRGGAGSRLRPHRPPFGHVGGVPGRRGLHRRVSFEQSDAPGRDAAAPRAQRDRQPGQRAWTERTTNGGRFTASRCSRNGSGSPRWRTGSWPRSWSFSAAGPCSARTARRSRSAGSATRPPTRSLPGRRN